MTRETLGDSRFCMPDTTGRASKILLVDFHAQNINPTPNLLPSITQNAGDTLIFGPGFVSEKILRRGLEAFIEVNGPFDVAFFTERPRRAVLRNYGDGRNGFDGEHVFFDRRLILEGIRYCEVLKASGIPLIATMYESDYYGIPQKHIDLLNDMNAYILGWGDDIWDGDDYDNRPPATDSDHYILSWRNANWDKFLRSNAHKVISIPHHLADHEFCNDPLSMRKHKWTVQGAHYTTRMQARLRLNDAGLLFEDTILKYIWPFADKLNISLYNHRLAIQFLNAMFFKNFRNSKYSYTCGSVARMLIRKYFEIPALGAVLVCSPSTGLQAVGFVPGKNCIVCEPEDILDVHAWLEANPDKAQEIADAGRTLVRSKHTVMARGQQLRPVLERIREGTFTGSRWENGNFILTEPIKP